ncbi:hypothetical protein Tco_0191063 [Tanacetum coccineum]
MCWERICLNKICKKNGSDGDQRKEHTLQRKEARQENQNHGLSHNIKDDVCKLVQQIDTFVPINLEATKVKLKRYGEELQTKTSKKQRFDDKDVPAIGDKVAEVKEEEPIMRANGADTVYMSFGAMVKDFTREDLIELYMLVMQKYRANRLEDAYNRVL